MGEWFEGTYGWLVAFLAVVGTGTGIYTFMKKGFSAILKPVNVKLETLSTDINKKIDKVQETLDEKLDKVDKNATMNYLVARMDEIEKGTELDGVARKRFIDELEHYINDLGGNSYILDEAQRFGFTVKKK